MNTTIGAAGLATLVVLLGGGRAAAEPPPIQLGDILRARAGPTPPDTMLGVTIGSTFARSGFDCTPSRCTKADVSLVGIHGDLSVIMCEGKAEKILWMSKAVSETSLATTVNTIVQPMFDAGWIDGAPFAVSVEGKDAAAMQITALDGRTRAVLIMPAPEGGSRVVMSASAAEPCVAGLGL